MNMTRSFCLLMAGSMVTLLIGCGGPVTMTAPDDRYCRIVQRHLHVMDTMTSLQAHAKLHLDTREGEMHTATDIYWKKRMHFKATIYNPFGSILCTMQKDSSMVTFTVNKRQHRFFAQTPVRRSGVLAIPALSFNDLITLLTARIPADIRIDCNSMQATRSFLSLHTRTRTPEGHIHAHFGGIGMSLKKITWIPAGDSVTWRVSLRNFDDRHRAHTILFHDTHGYSFALQFNELSPVHDPS
jgi:hypothetical protein